METHSSASSPRSQPGRDDGRVPRIGNEADVSIDRSIDHIVVDGGSTDGTLDISEALAPQVAHGSTLRATQGTRVQDEFDTLRRSMMTIVDPPRPPKWERFKTSLTWRVRQLEVFRAVKARYPRKCQHFAQQLHAHGVEVRVHGLRVLAPARWRGDASLFGHARSQHDLLDVIA